MPDRQHNSGLLRATNASACVLAEPLSSSSASRRADVYQTCLGTAHQVLRNTSLDKSVPAGGYLCLSLHSCCAERCHSSSPKRKETVLPSPCRTKDAPLLQHPSQVCPLSCCCCKGIPSASLRSKADTPKITPHAPHATRWMREGFLRAVFFAAELPFWRGKLGGAASSSEQVLAAAASPPRYSHLSPPISICECVSAAARMYTHRCIKKAQPAQAGDTCRAAAAAAATACQR